MDRNVTYLHPTEQGPAPRRSLGSQLVALLMLPIVALVFFAVCREDTAAPTDAQPTATLASIEQPTEVAVAPTAEPEPSLIPSQPDVALPTPDSGGTFRHLTPAQAQAVMPHHVLFVGQLPPGMEKGEVLVTTAAANPSAMTKITTYRVMSDAPERNDVIYVSQGTHGGAVMTANAQRSAVSLAGVEVERAEEVRSPSESVISYSWQQDGVPISVYGVTGGRVSDELIQQIALAILT